ncbi:hypothetical protein BRADI_1g42037v3 [Brachypodium distachyon]|uniref:Uncharacterized protein n=1 Tax=Brachypodium distachyon TaxID=15368 RepID=A0A2K2DNU2_BRADI|nr:hypothetical protein BRADI_1g42037v3 [Brachypodium distachyon]
MEGSSNPDILHRWQPHLISRLHAGASISVPFISRLQKYAWKTGLRGIRNSKNTLSPPHPSSSRLPFSLSRPPKCHDSRSFSSSPANRTSPPRSLSQIRCRPLPLSLSQIRRRPLSPRSRRCPIPSTRTAAPKTADLVFVSVSARCNPHAPAVRMFCGACGVPRSKPRRRRLAVRRSKVPLRDALLGQRKPMVARGESAGVVDEGGGGGLSGDGLGSLGLSRGRLGVKAASLTRSASRFHRKEGNK